MFISVIIPTYNRPEQLINCLKSLKKQILPREDWEVVVVDDGSPQELYNLIENESLNYNWKYSRQNNSGPATARNKGAQLAKGKYLAFIDDDCEADGQWLLELRKILQPGVLVGGKTINKLKNNCFSESSQILIDYLYKTLIGSHLMFFTSNNFAVEKDAFLASGAFSQTFKFAAGEDREFSIRFNHLGFQLKYAPAVTVMHAHNLKLSSFLRQHFTYGRASHQFRVIMNHLGISLAFDDRCFFLRLICYPLGLKKYSILKRLKLSSLLCLSQFIYAIGAIYEIYFSKHGGSNK